MNKETNSEIDILKYLYYSYNETLFSEEEKEGGEWIFLGNVDPKKEGGFVVYFMDWWVSIIDNRLDRVAKYSTQYGNLLADRGITLTEYKLALSAKSQDYFSERVFEYLMITDKQEHDFFISKHTTSNEQDALTDGFLSFVMEDFEKGNPLLKEFFFSTGMELHFPISSLKKHTYILGASGSGKSEVIKNLWYDLQEKSRAKNSMSLIALEPSGKLIRELLQFHFNDSGRERVVYLDTNIRETAKQLLKEDIFDDDYIFILNPFDLKNKSVENLNYMTPALSSAVFELMNEDQKKGQMGNLIKACIDLLLSMDGTSFIDLRDINDEETPQKYMSAVSAMKNPTRKEFMQKKFLSKKMESSKNGVYQRVHDIIDDMYLTRVLTGGNTVDLEKEMNSGKVILFNPTGLQKKSVQAYGKLLVCLIQGYSEKKQNFDNPFPVFLFMDEVQNYITPTIEDMMAESRKYGLHMVLANQILGQKMDGEMKRIILGNTAIKVGGDMEEDSMKVMGKAMGGLSSKDFDKLPKYNFFIHNRENKKAGARMFKASGKLVDTKSDLFMNKEQLKEFFLWTVHKSGYYVPLNGEKKTQERQADFKPIWDKKEK